MSEPDSVTLRFEAPQVRKKGGKGTTVPLSANVRLHWTAQRKYLAVWRQEVAVAWLTLPVEERRKVQGMRCRVEVTYGFPDARRRDPHNYVAPHTKALVDELVRCGVWEDDCPEWVTVAEPILQVGTECTIKLTVCP